MMSVYREWHCRLAPLGAVTRSIVEGKHVMPKPRFALLPSRRPNHASWERNQAAKIALGPKFATWICQGIVEVPRGTIFPFI